MKNRNLVSQVAFVELLKFIIIVRIIHSFKSSKIIEGYVAAAGLLQPVVQQRFSFTCDFRFHGITGNRNTKLSFVHCHTHTCQYFSSQMLMFQGHIISQGKYCQTTENVFSVDVKNSPKLLLLYSLLKFKFSLKAFLLRKSSLYLKQGCLSAFCVARHQISRLNPRS